MSSKSFVDPEFGEVSLRYYKASRNITFKVNPKGKLYVSAPNRTPKIYIKSVVNQNRRQIKKLLSQHKQQATYDTNQPIGKSHKLAVVTSSLHTKPSVELDSKNRTIIARLNSPDQINRSEVQAEIQQQVIKALKKEAKAYLPRRLQHLAQKHGFSYQKTRLSHAGTRWGSCSSSGTISLNIALMKLDFELIDYVLLHELSHTQQMNHSKQFWKLLESVDPDYLQHRRQIKKYSPAL